MKKTILIIGILFYAVIANSQIKDWDKLTNKQKDAKALEANNGNLYLWFAYKTDFIKWVDYIRKEYLFEDRFGKQMVDKKFSINYNSFVYSTKITGKVGYVKLTTADRLRLWSPEDNFNFHFVDSIAKSVYNFRRMYNNEFKKLGLK